MNGRELREGDLRAVARYVDGEMSVAERAAFEQRLASDGRLSAAVDDQRGLRGLFEPERRAPGPVPSPGFAARTLAAARRAAVAPVVAISDPGFELHCRRLMVAAALVGLLGLLAFAGLLRRADDGRLEASPAEIRQQMERLDDLVMERARAGERR